MKPFVFFDLGGTLTYEASREERFRLACRSEGLELGENEAARAFYRADLHFMEHAPALWHSNTRLSNEAHLRRVAQELGLDAPPASLGEGGRPAWLPFPESMPALLLLRAIGCRCGLITNWDYTARDVVARLGLERLLSPIVVSSEAGCEKPERRVFELALDAAGVGPHEAVYVGNDYWADVVGAQAAGLDAVLVDRHPEWSERSWPCRTIPDLWGVVRVVNRRREPAARIS